MDVRGKVKSAWKWVKHTAGTGKLLAQDTRIPKPLRWGLVVCFGFGWLIVGPIDELLGCLILALVWIKWRHVVLEHHHRV